ncbi:MAG: hypothetical protein ACHP7J_06120 [Terriglobales bacterium]
MAPVYDALRQADAAGDTAGAQKLAAYIKAQGTAPAVNTPAPAPVEETTGTRLKNAALDVAGGVAHGIGTTIGVGKNIGHMFTDAPFEDPQETGRSFAAPFAHAPDQNPHPFDELKNNPIGHEYADTQMAGIRSALDTPAGNAITGALGTAGEVAGTLGGATAAGRSLIGAGSRALVGAEAPAPLTGYAARGFRTAEDAPIARAVAGQSGQDALTIHNQQIGDITAAKEAGADPTAPPNYQALEDARAAPNAVHARIAGRIPAGPLSPAAQQMVNAAGGVGERMTTGTPNANGNIASLQAQMTDPERTFTGNQIVNEHRALRQEGYKQIASDDVSNQQEGRARLDMARALEQHMEDSLPPNSDVSMAQLRDAKTALAKNYAVQAAMRGDHVDMGAIARMQRADPQLLTGGLKDMADFANENPTVSGLSSRIYNTPSIAEDIGAVGLNHPLQGVAQVAGGAIARRALTGSTETALTRARNFGPPGSEMAPLPPGELQMQSPPGQVGPPMQRELSRPNPEGNPEPPGNPMDRATWDQAALDRIQGYKGETAKQETTGATLDVNATRRPGTEVKVPREPSPAQRLRKKLGEAMQ